MYLLRIWEQVKNKGYNNGIYQSSDDEIDRAVNEAERYAEEDRKRREEIEVRNNADSLVYTTEKTIKDLGAILIPATRIPFRAR